MFPLQYSLQFSLYLYHNSFFHFIPYAKDPMFKYRRKYSEMSRGPSVIVTNSKKEPQFETNSAVNHSSLRRRAHFSSIPSSFSSRRKVPLVRAVPPRSIIPAAFSSVPLLVRGKGNIFLSFFLFPGFSRREAATTNQRHCCTRNPTIWPISLLGSVEGFIYSVLSRHFLPSCFSDNGLWLDSALNSADTIAPLLVTRDLEPLTIANTPRTFNDFITTSCCGIPSHDPLYDNWIVTSASSNLIP